MLYFGLIINEKICYYCCCSHIKSLVELEIVIVATPSYFEHSAPLTYSLWGPIEKEITWGKGMRKSKKCRDEKM